MNVIDPEKSERVAGGKPLRTFPQPALGLSTKLNYGLGATAAGVAYAALSGAVLQYYLNQVMTWFR